MPCITDECPAINAIESDWAQAKEKLSETERELRQAEIDHAFNWWWYNVGSRPPKSQHDLEEHTEAISREAFNEAVKRFGISSEPAPVKPMTEERAGLLYSLFAIGIVVGMFIAFVTFFLVIKPN
jgi:hypothetical protein